RGAEPPRVQRCLWHGLPLGVRGGSAPRVQGGRMARLDDRPATAEPTRTGATLPRWVRWYLGIFLVAFVLCGVIGIEAWPLTGWGVFPGARPDRQPGRAGDM